MIKIEQDAKNERDFYVELEGTRIQVLAEIAVAIRNYAQQCKSSPLKVIEELKRAFVLEEVKNANK
jgi:hypothetical protein